MKQKGKADRDIEKFADWFERRLTELGYDLSPRGGGRKRFAAHSGVSPATVSRILLRQSIPDPRVLAQIAAALGEPLGQVLVLAGVATPEEVEQATSPPPIQRITPEQAAAALGITGSAAVRLFVAYTRELQRATHGGEPEPEPEPRSQQQ